MFQPLKRGLILALTLALLLTGAAAGEASDAKAFLERVLLPAAMVNASEQFTPEELQAIKLQAGELGYPLTETLAQHLDSPFGAYKVDILRAAMADSMGMERTTWPLEDQIWFEDMLVKAGLLHSRNLISVQPGDISQEEALGIAVKRIVSEFSEAADLMDPARWLVHRWYREVTESPQVTYRQWEFAFQAKTLEQNSYLLMIRHDGLVQESRMEPGLAEGMSPAQVEGRYIQVYGSMSTWEYATWQAFKKDLRNAMASGTAGEPLGSLPVFLMMQHLQPGDSHLPREQAITIAAAHTEAPGDLDLAGSSALLLLDDDTPVWKVRLLPRAKASGLVYPFLVEVDATTGEVRAARQTEAANYSRRRDYQLDSFLGIGQVPTPQPQPTLRPDGKPWYWYAERLPAYFWEAMDQLFEQGQQENLALKWEQEYGSLHFWPLPAQAYAHLTWFNVAGVEGTISGLPDAQDIKQEEAIAIAKKALVEQGFDQAELEAALPAVSFYYSEEAPSGHLFSVDFYKFMGKEYALIEGLTMDAKSGEVLSIGGNG